MNELDTIREHKLKSDSMVWNIELTDIGAQKPFLGFSLSDQYLLVGVTSPNEENLVSINSIPEQDVHQFSIPLDLERHQVPVSGEIHFKGIEKLSSKWSIYLYDRKSNETMEVNAFNPVRIKPGDFEHREPLHWTGFKKNRTQRESQFELHLTRK